MAELTPLARLKINVTEKSPFMGTADSLVVSRADIKWLLADHATLLARAEAAERRVGELEGALLFVEWEGTNYRRGELVAACPACEQARTDGHAADCPILLALAAPAPGATPVDDSAPNATTESEGTA